MYVLILLITHYFDQSYLNYHLKVIWSFLDLSCCLDNTFCIWMYVLKLTHYSLLRRVWKLISELPSGGYLLAPTSTRSMNYSLPYQGLKNTLKRTYSSLPRTKRHFFICRFHHDKGHIWYLWSIFFRSFTPLLFQQHL